MCPLIEWCFDFHVHGTAGPIPRRLMEDLISEEAAGWAEARRLGIGGGCRPASPEADAAALCWRFDFGLCATEDGRLIPGAQAVELEGLLRAWCEERGFDFVGGFRRYTQEELGGADA